MDRVISMTFGSYYNNLAFYGWRIWRGLIYWMMLRIKFGEQRSNYSFHYETCDLTLLACSMSSKVQSWKSVIRALRVSVYVWCLGCGWFSSMIKCCTDGNLWYQLPTNDCAVWLHYWEADPSESQWPCNHCHRYTKWFLSAWKPSKNVCSTFYIALTKLKRS